MQLLQAPEHCLHSQMPWPALVTIACLVQKLGFYVFHHTVLVHGGIVRESSPLSDFC